MTELPDEAVDIAGALQTAGFVHTVATRWAVLDRFATRFVAAFYERLAADGGRLDYRSTADAVHRAVENERTRPGASPLVWAPWVHIGP